MNLDKYIADLLYRYDCVIVPGFGGFLTNEIGSKISVETNRFFPPKKELAFNINLSNNDGLLANYISKAKSISFEKANEEIALEVLKIKEELNLYSSLEIKGVGNFTKNSEGLIQFSADESQNYLTSSYGLNSFTAIALNNPTEKVIELSNVLPSSEKTLGRTILKYAAVVLPLLTVASLAYYNQLSDFNLNLNNAEINFIPTTKVEKKVEPIKVEDQKENISLEKAAELKPIEETKSETKILEEVKKENKKIYHVISGAFSIEKNAEKKVRILNKKGISSEIIGQNKHGLYIVSYESFENVDQAREFLNKIKVKDNNKSAWIWKHRLK